MKAAEERKKKLQRLETGEEDEDEEEGGRKRKGKEGSEIRGEEEDAGINWGMSKYCFGLLYTQKIRIHSISWTSNCWISNFLDSQPVA